MQTEVKKTLSKKLIGSAVFALLLGAMTLSTSASVKALFIDTSKIINIDASVVSVGASSLVVDTVGTPNITIDVNDKTVFTGGSSMSVIAAGDNVHITAKSKEGDNPLALVVRKTGTGYGYGSGGKNVTVTDGEVTGKTADTFTVETNATTVTFKVLASTIFNKGNFLTLKIGDEVLVDGEEALNEFIATSVVIKSGDKDKNDDKKNSDDKEKNDDKGKNTETENNEDKDKNNTNGKNEDKDTHANSNGNKNNDNGNKIGNGKNEK